MSKIFYTNKREWIEQLENELSKTGFVLDFKKEFRRNETVLLKYKKLNISTENYFQEGSDWIAYAGTAICDGSILDRNYLKKILDSMLMGETIASVRKEIMGSYVLLTCIDNDMKVVIDAAGSYEFYYFNGNGVYLLANAFFYIAQIIKSDINVYSFFERIFEFCIIDNETVFEHIYRLLGNECIQLDVGSGEIRVIPLEESINKYDRKPESIEEAVDDLYELILKYAKLMPMDVKPWLLMTGGCDTRVELAIDVAMEIKPNIVNWYGKNLAVDSAEEDTALAAQMAQMYGLKFYSYFMGDKSEISDIPYIEFIKYGEHAMIYSNDANWFEIFNDKDKQLFQTGYFGETIRGVGPCEEIEKDQFSIDEFVGCYCARRRKDFSKFGCIDFGLYQNRIKEKMIQIAQRIGIDPDSMTQEDGMILYYHYRLHADTRCNAFFNNFGLSMHFFAEKEIADYINIVPYEYKKDNRFNLMLTQKLASELLQVPYFAHCLHMNFDESNMVLKFKQGDKVSPIDAKHYVKIILEATKIGRLILSQIREKKSAVRNQKLGITNFHEELIKKINESEFSKIYGICLDGYSSLPYSECAALLSHINMIEVIERSK